MAYAADNSDNLSGFGPNAVDLARKRLAAQQADQQAASVVTGGDRAMGAGKGALSGAATGASIGSAILPGWGTAIGAAAGGIAGGIGGALTAEPKQGAGNAAQDGLSVADQLKKNKIKFDADELGDATDAGELGANIA